MKLTYTIFYVNNVPDSVNFYQNALGLEVRFIHEEEDYAEFQTGETVFALCQKSLANEIIRGDFTPANLDEVPIGSQITFSPKDVQAAYRKAIENGATSVAEPEIKPWNFEVAIIRDNDGHLIEFAKNLNP